MPRDEFYDFDFDYDAEDEYLPLDDVIDFELFRYEGGDADTHGHLKSQFESKDGELVYWSDDKASFTIGVERLLQADGYADSTKKDRMTLLVFKVVLACNSHSKISQARFEMSFKDTDAAKAKVQPEVVAWAPFNEQTRHNPVSVRRTTGSRVGLDLGGGLAGVSATGRVEHERFFEWTQTHWETANAIQLWDRVRQKPDGVRWKLTANRLDTQGVPPRLTVGILLSRQSDEPYLGSFHIKVTGGGLDDLRTGIRRMFGRHPASTRPYQIKPSAVPIMRGLGHDIMKRVKLDSMRELRGADNSLVLGGSDERDVVVVNS